jgi:hypothetical protein
MPFESIASSVLLTTGEGLLFEIFHQRPLIEHLLMMADLVK